MSLELGRRAAPQGPGVQCGAHVLPAPSAEETQAAGKLRERVGAERYKYDHACQTEAIIKKDQSSRRRRGGVNQRDLESDASAR